MTACLGCRALRVIAPLSAAGVSGIAVEGLSGECGCHSAGLRGPCGGELGVQSVPAGVPLLDRACSLLRVGLRVSEAGLYVGRHHRVARGVWPLAAVEKVVSE